MKIIVPDYYEDFFCKKGECIHTCCSNWEVEIDSDTFEYYDSLSEDNKSWIMSNISEINGTHFFKHSDDRKCAFLRSDGLCEMIIRLGPDSLCDICLEHPLFRNYFSDRVEVGLGISCESACSLILSKEEPVEFLQAEEGDVLSLSKEDELFFSFRDEILCIAQDRSKSIIQRIKDISSVSGFSMPCSKEFLSFVSTLEYLDPLWPKLLVNTNNCRDFSSLSDYLSVPFEQYMVYIIYRNANFGMEYVISLLYLCLYLISANPETNIMDIARLISSEIEYSDENPLKILNFLKAEH